ncbi:dihydroorotase [Pseudohongiella sp.]|uniref:dihydroorotase n=1 Tax=marine sediment metagenome TaxID=412755 RepID=A0A0F9Z0Z5_9ZZZZ|nr:dihydroorotase [Pseudohongiella sp.]HDZ09974.1 dihydroorotase [Pseudohongiella sp.]HEA64391.1 dihydroorotase [Pseudohongiella sp.]
MTEQTLTLTRPDDWHLHLRDGKVLSQLVAHSASTFRRAIVMPNLKPPVTTTQAALAYRQRIIDALPAGLDFEPLMTLYLTDTLSADEIHTAHQSGHVQAVKYYPAGATTNSDSGVTAIANAYPALETMAELGMPLLIHGEVTDVEVDIFDREKVFIEQTLLPLCARFPTLKIVLEHITTADAVAFVRQAGNNIAATITPQHLLYNRNHLLVGGVRPHLYCLPVLKRNTHQSALIDAATSGDKKFFLGTDSAPHARPDKETACGCAGCFSAHAALELYAEVFDQAGALDKLEAFASFHGPDFYGLPRNTDTITLHRESWNVPAYYPLADSTLVPLRAGEQIHWRIKGVTA